MCGIALILKKHENVHTEDLKNLSDPIKHRGPDSSGYYINGNIGIAHRRLSIIDLSADGKQPMKIGKYVITYNGEIFNYLELKAELESYGVVFYSESDTEVVLRSFIQFGENCFEKFNGMWALCIYNEETNSIIVSRDRFGIKPLYTYEDNDVIIYCSEIKQILNFCGKSFRANTRVLLDYLQLGLLNHNKETFFDEIFQFPQSHYGILKIKKPYETQISRYYNLSAKCKKKVDNSSSYFNILKESVNLRLRSDVRVGSCFSGGLDSSSIVAIANLYYNGKVPFTLFHVKTTNDNGMSEIEYVNELASKINCELIIIDGSHQNIMEKVKDTIKAQEEPFTSPSVILQYLLMERAKQEGCTVLLDGQGGDETLLGYERYYPLYISGKKIWEIPKVLIQISKHSKLNIYKLVAYLLYFKTSWLRELVSNKKHNYLKKTYRKSINRKVLRELAKSYNSELNLQSMELMSTQLPHLLRYEDKNSMYHSIETRLPFLDFNHVEAALCLPLERKIYEGWSKYILRKVTENLLPSSIGWRKEKMGFESGDNELIKNNYKQIRDNIFSSELISKLCDLNNLEKDLQKLNASRIWKLYTISLWEKEFEITDLKEL